MPDTSDKTLLAFDFGMRRIGVAVGQTVTCTASPLTTLLAKDGIPQWHEIEALIDQWRPDALIVGLPTRLDGSEQPITLAAKKFARRLDERFSSPVHMVDERLTSHAAENLLKDRNKRFSKEQIDAVAAKLILENWMNIHR